MLTQHATYCSTFICVERENVFKGRNVSWLVNINICINFNLHIKVWLTQSSFLRRSIEILSEKKRKNNWLIDFFPKKRVNSFFPFFLNRFIFQFKNEEKKEILMLKIVKTIFTLSRSYESACLLKRRKRNITRESVQA